MADDQPDWRHATVRTSVPRCERIAQRVIGHASTLPGPSALSACLTLREARMVGMPMHSVRIVHTFMVMRNLPAARCQI